MIMHDMKESHIGNKDDLVWDQYRHSKSIFWLFAPGWTNQLILYYIKITIFWVNLGTFQNYVEAKPLDKKCWNFAWRNGSWYALRQKKSEFCDGNSYGIIHILLVTVAFEDRV